MAGVNAKTEARSQRLREGQTLGGCYAAGQTTQNDGLPYGNHCGNTDRLGGISVGPGRSFAALNFAQLLERSRPDCPVRNVST